MSLEIKSKVLKGLVSVYDTQWFLGNLYAKGKGVQKNYEQAVRWYQKFAEQGYA